MHESVAHRLFRLLDRAAPTGYEAVVESALRLGTDCRVPDVGLVRADVPVGRRQVGRAPDQWLLAASRW